ncbi:DUF945 domain-containing protein [Escherichia coli]|nr:DUF945 domain-containing protein [Escherichia coli]
MRLASRFGYAANQIRRDRPLTHEELIRHVPSIFGEDRHTSRSERYAYIPTITVLENLQREGFQPFFACQTRVRDPGRRGYTKHMLRLRRAGEINGEHVPEIILLNSHDGTSSYQMLPGYFRFVCQNGCVCGQSLGEVRVPHRGNVVEKVIEGAYEVVGVFDRIPGQAASSRPSPVEIWQILLSRLLDQHYGLTLNDTPFADERVIEQHIEAGISLCDAVNFLVEKYALVLPTSRDSAPVPALS